MDALKDALKKKMMEAKSKPQEDSDMAPEGVMEEHDEAALEGKPEVELEGLDEATLMQILQAIADQGRGGEDSSLGGRAAMLAKSKMGQLKK